MGSAPFRVSVSCPTCKTAVRPHLTGNGAADAADVLWGREVTCRACETEFEVLFYPE